MNEIPKLINNNNRCYFNVVIQLLLCINSFIDYIKDYKEDDNTLINLFKNLINLYENNSDINEISNKIYYNIVNRTDNEFIKEIRTAISEGTFTDLREHCREIKNKTSTF